MSQLPLHNALQKKKVNLFLYTRTMKKFKLVKDKWYFQSLRETKSVKETEDGAVEISWYASTKDKDRWWDVVEPKAFQSALERYMTNPIVLLQHKADKPIGVVEEANIDENWLRIKAKISQNTDWVVDLIKNWVLRAFSIWYSIKDYETDAKELADWTYDFTNIIKDLELYEISVVSIPMNPYALSKSVEDMFEAEDVEEESEEENDVVAEIEAEAEETDKHDAEDFEKEIEENSEETSVETVAESEQSVEENAESTEVQEEQKSEEIESEEVEDEKIDENLDEKVEEPSQEAEEERKSEIPNFCENADENSEISDEVEAEEVSENAVETQADDEAIVETHESEVVETKSIETESQKQFDFESKLESFQKSFDEKLAIKDEKIKSLESKVEAMTKLFAESLETIDRMTTAVKNTPVASGLQYKRPLKKWWYYDIAEIIKSL